MFSNLKKNEKALLITLGLFVLFFILIFGQETEVKYYRQTKEKNRIIIVEKHNRIWGKVKIFRCFGISNFKCVEILEK